MELHSLDPLVRKPGGGEFRFWRNDTEFTRTYHVDARSAAASDDNPGTEERPFRTIARAAEAVGAGERVLVRRGVYRECVRPPRGGESPSRMIGYHAEEGGGVVVRGSELVGRRWDPEDPARGVWGLELAEIDFPEGYRPFELENIPDESFAIMPWAKGLRGKKPFTLPRGMVFQEGARLARATSRERMLSTEGSHWTDREAGRLYVRTRGGADPNDLAMEVTTRRAAFRPSVRGLGFVHVRGFVFEQVGNCFPRPQEGALSVCGGHHWLIEGNTVREANGIGIDIGDGWYGGRVRPPEPGKARPGWNIVRRNRVSRTGVCGIAGLPGADALIEENVLVDNTTYPVMRIYECAGIKTHNNRGALIRRNVIRDNSVNGIWMDWDNRDARCTQNVLVNCATGIFIEASVVEPFCSIDRNVVWGSGTGIYEHDCRGQTFVHNLVGRSAKGVVLRGKITQRTVAGRYPTAGGGHTVANNVFIDVAEDVEEHKSGDFPPSVVADNASEADGVEASFDADELTLTLRASRRLDGFCREALVRRDFLGRAWPAGARCPGPLPPLGPEAAGHRLGPPRDRG